MARLKRRSGGRIWHAWIPQPGGGTKLLSTNCTDRRAAELRAAELERDALDPASAAANKAETVDACNRFVASRGRAGRAKGTLHHYGVKLGHVARLVQARQFPAALRDLQTSEPVERYIDIRTEEGAARTTIKKEWRAIKAMLAHAKRTGRWLGEVERVMPEYEDDYKPRERWLTMWELVALCCTLPIARAAHVAFIVATGARWSESLRARAADVHDKHVHLHGTKTEASDRDVPRVELFDSPLEWAVAHASEEGTMFTRWGNVRRDLATACKTAGIKPVTPNDLRRTFSKWLRNGGVDPNHIAAAMGHTTSRMVERIYGRISHGELGVQIAARLMLGSGEKTEGIEPSGTTQTPEKTAETSCPGTESNRRHGDFQSSDLPPEDSGDSSEPPPPARLMLGGGEPPAVYVDPWHPAFARPRRYRIVGGQVIPDGFAQPFGGP